MKRPWRAEFRNIHALADAPWILIGTYATRKAAERAARRSQEGRFYPCHYRVTCREDGTEKEREL